MPEAVPGLPAFGASLEASLCPFAFGELSSPAFGASLEASLCRPVHGGSR